MEEYYYNNYLKSLANRDVRLIYKSEIAKLLKRAQQKSLKNKNNTKNKVKILRIAPPQNANLDWLIDMTSFLKPFVGINAGYVYNHSNTDNSTSTVG